MSVVSTVYPNNNDLYMAHLMVAKKKKETEGQQYVLNIIVWKCGVTVNLCEIILVFDEPYLGGIQS